MHITHAAVSVSSLIENRTKQMAKLSLQPATCATYMLLCSTLAPPRAPLAKPQKPLKYITLLY
jgi:hypothetical protein